MSEEKFEIGLKDVFTEVQKLGGQLAAYIQTLDPRVAVIEHRVGETEAGLKEIRDAAADAAHEAERYRHEERRHRTQIRWLILTTLIIALAGIAGSLLVSLLTH